MRVLTFVLVVFFALSASASTVRELIDQSKELEAELKYDVAAEILLQVIADDRATDEELMEANLRAGIIQRIIDNDVDARLHFNYVLQRAPDTPLPEGMPPKITAFFELIRKEVIEAKRQEAARANATPAPGPAPAPAPAPVDEGNPGLFWTGAATTGVGGLMLVSLGPLAAMGELTYADAAAPVAERRSAQDTAPLLWGGVGVGAALAVVGVVLIAAGG
jgi:hypothetical protein